MPNIPCTYFAHRMDSMYWDGEEYAVNFEAVPKELVEMFLTGERSQDISPENAEFLKRSRYFNDAWESFQQGTPDREFFLQQISSYLTEVPVTIISVLINEYSKVIQIEEEPCDWWELVVENNPFGRLAFCSFEQEDGSIEECLVKGNPLDMRANEILYDYYVGNEDLNHIGGDFPPKGNKEDSLDAINTDTVFSKIEVLYVGAGLSCRILDNVGNLVGYFDMGEELPVCEYQLNRRNQAAASMNQIKQVNRNLMMTDAAQGIAQTVIISHWHYDHVKVLDRLATAYLNNAQQNPYVGFWNNLTLIAPSMNGLRGGCVTIYNRIRRVMNMTCPQRFYQYPNLFQNQTMSYPVGNNINICLYKGNLCGPGDRHPHNNGIAAVIRLSNGNTVFLPGDCSYDTLYQGACQGVLDNGGIGYDYLVATHHGGTYLSSLQPNGSLIPAPEKRDDDATLVYSANGVSYGHPNPVCQADHVIRGWNNEKCLHQLSQTGYYAWILI